MCSSTVKRIFDNRDTYLGFINTGTFKGMADIKSVSNLNLNRSQNQLILCPGKSEDLEFIYEHQNRMI